MVGGGQHDVVLKLKKRLYGQAKTARLWYEKLWNALLEHGLVMSKVDPFLFMSKNVICVVYVDDCLFLEISQSDIDHVMKSYKEDSPNYNWEHSNWKSVSDFLGFSIKTLDNGLVSAKDGPFFYTRSHLSALQNCALFSQQIFKVFHIINFHNISPASSVHTCNFILYSIIRNFCKHLV